MQSLLCNYFPSNEMFSLSVSRCFRSFLLLSLTKYCRSVNFNRPSCYLMRYLPANRRICPFVFALESKVLKTREKKNCLENNKAGVSMKLSSRSCLINIETSSRAWPKPIALTSSRHLLIM